MKYMLFVQFLLQSIFIGASPKQLVMMEKQINHLSSKKPCAIKGYTISHYDSFSADPSDKGLSELWDNPKIIADAGHFMILPENQILTLRDDTNLKKVASCIKFGIVDDCGYIDQLATHPGYQGKGLARKLIEEAEFFCGSHGCTLLKLLVYSDNMPAILFYQKMGFVKSV
ncbi:GNAT family N-acetyltransferase [Candidatus Dependentiae bacterium]|nr:GNAT family N-acetyltransferase [Candidatus Dependentiae bacterium]